MKKLEFTVQEMQELVEQGDAHWLNRGDHESYFNVVQRTRLEMENTKKYKEV